MKLTNCNCGEKVSCNCGTLSFDSYSNNTFGVLTVGNLVASGCTLQEYVIDWYVGGVKMLTSGVGSDPDITAFHPFLGTASIPLIDGLWTPVVRYVIVGGNQIFLSPKNCKKWCEMSVDLPAITVQSIKCGIVAGTPILNYDFRLRYISSQDYALSSRTIRYILADDLSTKQVAFNFVGQTISDLIEVFWKDETTPITAWAVGSDAGIGRVCQEVLPHRHNLITQCKFTVAVPDGSYQVGDYFTIKITPSFAVANVNTNWDLNIKCLTEENEVDCSIYDGFERGVDYDSFEVVDYQSGSICRKELYFDINLPTDIRTTSLYKYANFDHLGHSSGTASWVTGKGRCMINYNISSSQYAYLPTSTLKVQSEGTMNFNKSGNVATFTFSEENDYLRFRNKWDDLQATSFFSDWSNYTNTDEQYYRFVNFRWYTAAVNCGDQETLRSFYFFITSQVDFNDTLKTIVVTVDNVANNLSNPGCYTLYGNVNSIITSITNWINASAFSEDTRCIDQNCVQAIRYFSIPPSISALNQGFSFSGYGAHCGVPCDIVNAEGWYFNQYTSTFQRLDYMLFYLRFVITDWDWPEGNFEVWEGLDYTTGRILNDNERFLVYKKVNGVRTV